MNWNGVERPDGTDGYGKAAEDDVVAIAVKGGAVAAYAPRGGWRRAQRAGDHRWNFVHAADESLLSDTWFDGALDFGNGGAPAYVKEDGLWRALYGRRADGTPDLGAEALEADALTRSDTPSGTPMLAEMDRGGSGKFGYVDASLSAVGPDGFPFQYAEPFHSYAYGGKWARVNVAYLDGKRANLMGLDGTLAFGGSDSILPDGLWEWPLDPPRGTAGRLHERGSRRLRVRDSRGRKYPYYTYAAFDGWSRIARLGIRVGGDEGAPLDGEGGRLALGTACDRNTGMIYECIVVRDAWNENHIACLLDGDGAAIAAKE